MREPFDYTAGLLYSAGMPEVNLILATAEKVYIRSGHNMDRFRASLAALEAALLAGKVWNQEFISHKSNISRATEHAQHIAADATRTRGQRYGDVRDEIGYAFQMNQAAKLSRSLKKLPAALLTPEIQLYIDTLDQITALWDYLKQFKPLIIKGRKPSENHKEPDITNTGICAACECRQKLGSDLRMVHHGFKISNGGGQYFGYRAGRCIGCDYLPYEFSADGTRALLVALKQQLEFVRKTLRTLEARPQELREDKVVYPIGTPEYEQVLAGKIAHTKSTVSHLRTDIKRQESRIAAWQLRPLLDGTTLTQPTEAVACV